MNLSKKLLPMSTLAALLLGFGVQSASADILQFTLSVGNSGLVPGSSGPYADVTINQIDGTHASISFAADSGFMLTDGGSVGVNVNGASFTASNFTWSGQPQNPISAPSLSSAGAGNEDGWGNFNFRIDNGASFQSSVKNISFDLTLNSGTWANAADVLTANNKGNIAAAHIGVLAAGNGSFSTTGFATDDPLSINPTGGGGVPDGGTTASLLGMVLAAGALVSRRKKYKM